MIKKKKRVMATILAAALAAALGTSVRAASHASKQQSSHAPNPQWRSACETYAAASEQTEQSYVDAGEEDPFPPEEKMKIHRSFMAVCLKYGPNSPQIQAIVHAQ